MFAIHKMRWLLAALLVLPGGLANAAEKKIKVTATTTMVADFARNVGGDRVEVETLMGPGVDPHLYKAAASDTVEMPCKPTTWKP